MNRHPSSSTGSRSMRMNWLVRSRLQRRVGRRLLALAPGTPSRRAQLPGLIPRTVGEAKVTCAAILESEVERLDELLAVADSDEVTLPGVQPRNENTDVYADRHALTVVDLHAEFVLIRGSAFPS